jgi:hypothetical protein
MQEPHKKGVANHLGPESCVRDRKVTNEALTGEDAGQPWSSEITSTGVPTLCNGGEGHTVNRACRERFTDAAESETLSMRGRSMRENRETPSASSTHRGEERSEKSGCSTSDRHAVGESDDLIVPAKRANKAGLWAAAESVEGRRSTKGNAFAVGHAPDTAPDPRVDRREGVRSVASACWTVFTRGKSRMR